MILSTIEPIRLRVGTTGITILSQSTVEKNDLMTTDQMLVFSTVILLFCQHDLQTFPRFAFSFSAGLQLHTPHIWRNVQFKRRAAHRCPLPGRLYM